MSTNTKHISALYIVIALLMSTICVMQCSDDVKQPDKIVIPEEKGVLKDKDPKEVISDSIFIYKLRDTIIKYNRPVDTVYIKEYIKAPEHERTKKYIEAIAKRQYKDTVEDDRLRIHYTANTQGLLDDIEFDYLIKEREMSIPAPKKSVFAVYGGADLKTTTKFDEVTPVGILGFQNKKGTIIYGQYGLDGSIQAGVMYRLLDIKK